MRPIGENQLACLRSLVDHGQFPGGGWVWDNVSGTERILDSLVRRGLVKTEQAQWKNGSVYTRYSATPEGVEAAKYEYQRIIERLKK